VSSKINSLCIILHSVVLLDKWFNNFNQRLLGIGSPLNFTGLSMEWNKHNWNAFFVTSQQWNNCCHQ